MKSSILLEDYTAEHFQNCMDLFDSNCPPFFAPYERDLFKRWLLAIEKDEFVFPNIEANHFYILRYENEIVACGGFYLLDNKTARLSWGMVLDKLHKNGFGTILFQYRLDQLRLLYPNYRLAMDTSQLSVDFYKRMGFKVTDVTVNGYGEGLDKYEMIY